MGASEYETDIKVKQAFDSSDALSPGTILDDRFEIISPIGKGGMSVVYKAMDLRMHRDVAIKFLKRYTDPGLIKRFQREAMAISSVRHPNIVGVFSLGCRENVPYIVMEYLQGGSLADLLSQEKRLTPERALPIFCQICDALAQAHDNGIIHRDLKPSNIILVEPGDTVKLVDFGIAKILDAESRQSQSLTRDGELFGTVLYMSPEQCLGHPVDARSDIYSLGCLMYEAVVGEPPVAGDVPLEIMSRQILEGPKHSAFLEGSLGKAIMWCLEKEPLDRPQSAAELKEALLSRSGFSAPITQRGRRSLKGLIAAVATSVAIVLLGGFCVWQYGVQTEASKAASLENLAERAPDTPSRWMVEGDRIFKRQAVAGEPDYQRYADAEPMFRKAMTKATDKVTLRNARMKLVTCLEYLHEARNLNTLPEAEKILEKVSASLPPPTHHFNQDYADWLEHDSKVKQGLKKFEEAIASSERRLRYLNSTEKGSESDEAASTHYSLARSYSAMNRPEQSFQEDLKAADLWNKLGKFNYFGNIETAQNYINRGEFAKAEKYLSVLADNDQLTAEQIKERDVRLEKCRAGLEKAKSATSAAQKP